MDLGNGLGHLTYSTLVHPGDNWEQMWASLETYVPKVKARIAPQRAVRRVAAAVGESAQTLRRQRRRARQAQEISRRQRHVPLHRRTRFPYGAFKGTVVKEQVYEPDWRSEERTALHDATSPTCSPTSRSRASRRRFRRAPLGFKPRVTGPDVVASYTDHVLRVAAHLVELEAQTGTHRDARARAGAVLLPRNDRRDRRLFHARTSTPAPSARKLAKLAQIPISEAHGALRRHSASCSTSAIRRSEYEDIADVAAEAGRRRHPDLQAAGGRGDAHAGGDAGGGRCAEAVRRDDLSHADDREEGRQAHAVSSISKTPSPRGRRTRARANGARTSTCRCSSTISARSARRVSPSRRRCSSTRRSRCRAQLEIETYTWDVLPDSLKTGDIVDYVVPRDRLGARGQLSVHALQTASYQETNSHEGRIHRARPHGPGDGAAHARRRPRGRRSTTAPRKGAGPLIEPARRRSARSRRRRSTAKRCSPCWPTTPRVLTSSTRRAACSKALPKGGIHICAGTHSVAAIQELRRCTPKPGKF